MSLFVKNMKVTRGLRNQHSMADVTAAGVSHPSAEHTMLMDYRYECLAWSIA